MKKSNTHTRAHVRICARLYRHRHTMHRQSTNIQSSLYQLLSLRPLVRDYRRLVTHHVVTVLSPDIQTHKTKSKARRPCEQTQTNSTQAIKYVSRRLYTCRPDCVCVCVMTALFKSPKLMNSRLAPKEQQMFSGVHYFKVPGHFEAMA